MTILQNRGQLRSCLFPNKPRDFPFRRTVRISTRALHIFSAGVLLGGHIFNQPVAILEPWLWATVITGIIILLTDLHATLAILFELRGMAILIKLTLILFVPVFWDQRVTLLICALLIGAISSHLPKRYRHKLFIIHDDIHSDQRSG